MNNNNDQKNTAAEPAKEEHEKPAAEATVESEHGEEDVEKSVPTTTKDEEDSSGDIEKAAGEKEEPLNEDEPEEEKPLDEDHEEAAQEEPIKVLVEDDPVDDELGEELTESERMARDRFLLDPKRRIKALSEQRYHLPGNNWKADWLQYFANNHPLFGVCFHHADHPIGWPMRLMCFLSSVVFGLAVTNAFWLWARSTDKNDNFYTVETGTRPGSNLTGFVVDVDDENNIQVTEDMVLLWTVGGFVHGLFDNLIWTLALCACCDPGSRFESLAKYKRFGTGLLAFFITLVMAVVSLSVVVRGVMESDDDAADVQELRSAGVFDDQLDLRQSNKESYEFMMSFSVELALGLLVYFPLTGTILFTGILGCYVIPQLGGRPFEVKEEQRELEEAIKNRELEEGWGDETPVDEPEVWGMKQPGDDQNGSCCCSCFYCGEKPDAAVISPDANETDENEGNDTDSSPGEAKDNKDASESPATES